MKSNFFYMGFIHYIEAAIVGWLVIGGPVIIGCVSHIKDEMFFQSKAFSLLAWIAVLFLCLSVFVALLVAFFRGDLNILNIKHDEVTIHRLFSKPRILHKPFNKFQFKIAWNQILAFKLSSSCDCIFEFCRLDGNLLIMEDVNSAKSVVAIMDKAKIRHSHISLTINDYCVLDSIMPSPKTKKLLESL